MKAGERELHLGLDARRSRDPAPRCRLQDVLQQRRLADPGLAAQDQHRALSRPRLLQLKVQRLALAAPPTQPRLGLNAGHRAAEARPASPR